MTYDSLKKQLEKVSGGKASFREDVSYSGKDLVPTFYIVEFTIENHDLFYKYIPPFAEYIFNIQCVNGVIASFNQRGIPYTISFPVEIE